MMEGVFYDISNKNIKIKSFNHTTNEIEFKKVISVVRKEDAKICKLVTKSGDVLLKCSSAHRIFDCNNKQYICVGEISEGIAYNNNNQEIPFMVTQTDEVVPIVDIQVEDNENYFTNGILSHNTTPGGNALKFAASIRIELRSLTSDEKDADGNKASKRVKAVVVKNKTFPPFRECEFTIRFGEGIDKIESIVIDSFDKGIFTRGGAWTYLFGEYNFANGMAAFREAIVEYNMIEDLKEAIDLLNKGKSLEDVKEIVSRNVPEEIFSKKKKVKPIKEEQISSDDIEVQEI